MQILTLCLKRNEKVSRNTVTGEEVGCQKKITLARAGALRRERELDNKQAE